MSNKTRADFQTFLQEYVGNNYKVYGQPPSNSRMVYPCVVYTYNRIDNVNADNIHYLTNNSYQLKVIDPDIDSALNELIKQLPMCSWDRFYTADNLNHFVYTFYY